MHSHVNSTSLTGCCYSMQRMRTRGCEALSHDSSPPSKTQSLAPVIKVGRTFAGSTYNLAGRHCIVWKSLVLVSDRLEALRHVGISSHSHSSRTD